MTIKQISKELKHYDPCAAAVWTKLSISTIMRLRTGKGKFRRTTLDLIEKYIRELKSPVSIG